MVVYVYEGVYCMEVIWTHNRDNMCLIILSTSTKELIHIYVVYTFIKIYYYKLFINKKLIKGKL